MSFEYCLESGEEELPCGKVVDCWWEYFDILEYLRSRFSEEDFNRLVNSPPKPKVTSLVELIKQAQDRVT